MPAHSTIRFIIHLRPGSSRVSWALILLHTDERGIPHATEVMQGSTDTEGAWHEGLDGVAMSLLRAVDHTA